MYLQLLAAVAGGGGYYGGSNNGYGSGSWGTIGLGANGGSNYIDSEYFTLNILDESGINSGNGYILIEKIN